jgi:hypothetical protein
MRIVDRNSLLILFALTLVAQLVISRHELRAATPAASVTGSVKLEGAPPHQRAIDMSKEPACAAQHKDHPLTAETVVAGSNGALANVVVYVSEGWNGGDIAAQAAAQPVLNQKGCQYQPHVLALDTNQRFKVTNSDQTSHNVHAIPKAGSANHEWNRSQSRGAPAIEDSWPAEEVAIHVKCNIHPWMSGYMVVVKGPYGVSDSKGSYEIENLPPGNYTLTAWQETLGTQTQKVTVTADKPATANFTFKAK